MANIAEYYEQLQRLTQQNLEILGALNSAFYTNKEHLIVEVGSVKYAVPSFLSLENKLNNLQDNFNNLVHAPKTGEAHFNVDGNSKTIELRGYTCTPERVTLDPTHMAGFSVEQNDIFKDFLTPNPYVKLDLSTIPNDVAEVNVRKVAVKIDALKNMLLTRTAPTSKGIAQIDWGDLWKMLSIYREDEDYVMYDTLRHMPIRKNIGNGTYTIKSIDSDEIDDLMDEHIVLTLHEDLKYKLFDETIDKYLAVGDELVTYDDNAKMVIEEVRPSLRQIKVRVLNGDYLNLVADPEGGLSSDYSRIKFFSPVNYDADKYINVPLEEDQVVCIFVAPLNGRMNVQAPWGGGIVIDTNVIKWDQDGKTPFYKYYEENIRNVGDILYEISSTMSATIMKYSEEDFLRFTNYSPVLDTSKLKVVQLNSHLNNSETVRNIRSLHSQKQEYNKQLEEVRTKILDITKTLAEVSFNDAGLRTAYESQLAQYNNQRSDLVTNILKIVNEISIAANDSTVPLESAKYRIRGYYQWYPGQSSTDKSISTPDDVLARYWDHIRGIKIQYRYKNQNAESGTAISIDENFIFSDWVEMPDQVVNKVPVYNGGYKFKYPQYTDKTGNGGATSHDNGRLNEPSFNQIDIPISQGEVVDVRIKIIWDFGWPFVESTSDWSNVANIKFPDEFLKDVPLLDIISENNNDIETNRFNNLLVENGVTPHIEDRIVDQDVTFMHKADSISSGFYTEERRVIPLRDKLLEFDQAIASVRDLISGTNSENISCFLNVEGTEYEILQNKENVVTLPAYNSTQESRNSFDGDQNAYAEKVHVINASLIFKNTSKHVTHLYSMFPANGDIYLNDLIYSRYGVAEYCQPLNKPTETADWGCVPICWPDTEPQSTKWQDYSFCAPQTAGQWITFRMKDIYTGRNYYVENGSKPDAKAEVGLTGALNPSTPRMLKTWQDRLFTEVCNGLLVYPYISDADYLKIPGSSPYTKIEIAPDDYVVVPIMIMYRFDAVGDDEVAPVVTRYLSFDIRTSLYNEPCNYLIKFGASEDESIDERVARAERNRYINKSILTSADAMYKTQTNS